MFVLPRELRRVPFDMKRTHNSAWVAPWNMIPAIEQYVADEPQPVMVLPAAMGQNKWKSMLGPAHIYAPSAGQLVRMNAPYTPERPYEPVPFQTQERVSEPLNRLPPMETRFDDTAPLARGVLDRRDLIDAPTMRRIARVLNDPTQNFDAIIGANSRRFPSTYVIRRR